MKWKGLKKYVWVWQPKYHRITDFFRFCEGMSLCASEDCQGHPYRWEQSQPEQDTKYIFQLSFGCLHNLLLGIPFCGLTALKEEQSFSCVSVQCPVFQFLAVVPFSITGQLKESLYFIFPDFIRYLFIYAAGLFFKWCPPGFQVLLHKAAFQMLSLQPRLMCSITVSHSVLSSTEFQGTSVVQFLQSVQVPLNGSPSIWCIRPSSQF